MEKEKKLHRALSDNFLTTQNLIQQFLWLLFLTSAGAAHEHIFTVIKAGNLTLNIKLKLSEG